MPIFVEKRSFSGTDCWWSPFKLTDVPDKDDDLQTFIEALKNSYIAFYTTVKQIYTFYICIANSLLIFGNQNIILDCIFCVKLLSKKYFC